MISTSEPDRYAQIVKQVSPAVRLAVAQRLRDTAWELAAAGVRIREPELSEDAVQERVRRVFMRVHT